MLKINKQTLCDCVKSTNECTNLKKSKNIDDSKLKLVADGFFTAKKEHWTLPNEVVNNADRLANLKIDYYENTIGGAFAKFLSALKNLFQFGEFSNTAVIAKRCIEEYKTEINKDKRTKLDDITDFIDESLNSLINTEYETKPHPLTNILVKMLSTPGVVIESWNHDSKTDLIEVKLKNQVETDSFMIAKNINFTLKKNK